MGAKLTDFAADPAATGAPLRIPSKSKKLPKSNYIGLFLVPKGVLPRIGSATTFTPPPSGSPVAVTTANIVSLLSALAFNGQCWAFGNGVVNGKAGPYEEDKESLVFGSRRAPRPTGEGQTLYDFKFKYFYMNREFFNQLRLNNEEYDILLFTDRSVEELPFDEVEPIFQAITDEVTGANMEEIVGGFQILTGSDGQVVPSFIQSSAFEKQIAASNFKYTFGTLTATGTGLTSALSGTVVNKTSVGSGTITNAVTQTVGAGVVSYTLGLSSGAALPSGLTINTTTGEITVGAGVVAGTYDLRVMVENKTGILGEYGFKLIAA